MKKDLENSPEVIRNNYSVIDPVVPKDATDLLLEGPVSPSSINAVIFSHLYFDHIGDCSKFPTAEIIVGPRSFAATSPGWPAVQFSPFSSAVLDHAHFRELSFEKESWVPLGPFPRAYDYFGDGSFFLVDIPGHMPGHMGAVACTSENEWIFSGEDCCHHRSLLNGERPMSVTVGPNGTPSFPRGPPVAMDTIEKVRLLSKAGNVLVVLVHDASLEGVMPEYPESLNCWRNSAWWRGRQSSASDGSKSGS